VTVKRCWKIGSNDELARSCDFQSVFVTGVYISSQNLKCWTTHLVM